MISGRDEIIQSAGLDALELADSFDRIPSREWDGKANGSWLKAADDAGLADREREALRPVYLAALVAECVRILDAKYAVQNEPDEQLQERMRAVAARAR